MCFRMILIDHANTEKKSIRFSRIFDEAKKKKQDNFQLMYDIAGSHLQRASFK